MRLLLEQKVGFELPNSSHNKDKDVLFEDEAASVPSANITSSSIILEQPMLIRISHKRKLMRVSTSLAYQS